MEFNMLRARNRAIIAPLLRESVLKFREKLGNLDFRHRAARAEHAGNAGSLINVIRITVRQRSASTYPRTRTVRLRLLRSAEADPMNFPTGGFRRRAGAIGAGAKVSYRL